MARGGLAVDGAAEGLRHRHVAVRRVALGRQARRPVAARSARAERAVERRGLAGGELGLEGASVARARRDELHGAAEGAAAVEVRRSAAQHLDPLDRQARQARPVDPAAEGVVERDAVGQHQRAARAARAQSAQRHALRGRVGGAAAGPPEQREAHDLAQRVVEEPRGGHAQRRGGHDRDARGRVCDARLLPGGGHGQLLGEPRLWLRRLVLRRGRGRAGEPRGERGKERAARDQRTVTGISTSALPRRHQASRVEQ